MGAIACSEYHAGRLGVGVPGQGGEGGYVASRSVNLAVVELSRGAAVLLDPDPAGLPCDDKGQAARERHGFILSIGRAGSKWPWDNA